ncbi:RING finger protein ETP1 [Penicillium digitatum]|uniref:RING finger protein ETP1 n=1 Tax=Penicillium digitatum TaxID=36651 RepID=A0A7T7BMF2_PENDI|nr:RING finger protein ETP1 [Penicillium digitatum]
MSPDLNSLAPSRSSSTSSSIPQRNMPPPATGPAPLNLNTASPRPSHGSSIRRPSVSERRRSAAGMNLNEIQGTSPGASSELPASDYRDHRSSIGHAFRTASPSSHGGSPIFATADPHHHRAPSLGELHQELEQEQEAQVNRLLQMIRSQQAQLQQYQQQHNPQSTAAIDDTTPASERSAFFPPGPAAPPASNSQATSPNLRPLDSRGPESMEPFSGLRDSQSRRGSRDESAFYQAEASSLARENVLLRQRIRELERQIGGLTTSQSASSATTTSGIASGQAGTETADPPAVGSTRDGKD